MDKKKIGERIDAIRKERGWSKADLARRINTSYPTVYKHIKTGSMSLDMLGRYAEALGYTIGDLTDGITDPRKFHLETDVLSYYPYNLAYAVCCNGNGKDPEKVARAKDMVYKVYIPALLKAVQTLSEKEQAVLNYRYRYGMTLKQTGNELHKTTERIRQIERKAFRKLNHWSCQQHWMLDVMETAIDLKKLCNSLEFENQTLTKNYNLAKMKLGIEVAKRHDTHKEPFDAHIDSLGFSARTYNCLMRAGYKHLSQFDGVPIETLTQIRNLGVKTLEEILLRLDRMGYKVDNDQVIRYKL